MHLEAITDCLGITIETTPPISGHPGEYAHHARTIRIHPDLTGPQRRWVLAHELGHAAYGHTETTATTELQADRFAHWLLIPFCHYLRAARLHDTAQTIAHEMQVIWFG